MARLHLDELVLIGYLPLSLSSIEEFKYTPENDWQVILGTNGCGKSSILRAATPTITDRNEFKLGGFKGSTWSDDLGRQFRLESHYGKTVKHSFQLIENGEVTELNPGGTGTVYQELVATYFNYTKATHELLTQDTCFTTMNKNQRESLILSISDCDIGYVMNVYDQLRSRHRDIVGAIKRLSVKQSTVSQRLASFTDIDQINDKVHGLRQQMKDITAYVDWSSLSQTPDAKQYVQDTIDKLDGSLAHYRLQMERFSVQLDTIRQADAPVFTSIEELTERMEALSATYNHNRGIRDKLSHNLQQYGMMLNRIDETAHGETVNVDDLHQRIALLKKKYEGYDCDKLEAIEYHTITATRKAYTNYRIVLDRLPSGFTYMGVDEVKKIQIDYHALELDAMLGDAEIKRAEKEVAELRNLICSKVTCDNCQHEFVPGSTFNIEEAIARTQESLTLQQTRLADTQAKIEALQNEFDNATAMNAFIDGLRPIMVAGFYLHDSAITLTEVAKNPTLLLTYLTESIKHCEVAEKWKADRAEIAKATELIRLTELVQNGNVVEKFEALEQEVDEYQKVMDHCLEQRKRYESLLKIHGNLEALLMEIHRHDQTLADNLIRYVQDTNVHEFTKQAKDIETELTALLATTRSYDDLMATQTFLGQEYDDLKEEEEAYQALLSAISPKTGLIADAIKSTLGSFVDQVNAMIANVWEHTLALHLPTAGNEINYLFPLQVDEDVKPDIGKGSSGEQDMINFAVRLVIMARKKLNGFPLFMDEVGNTFDPRHRTNLMEFIKHLVSAGRVGQIFMVNHFVTEYGGISGADINVLNANNLEYKGLHNQCLQMVHY